ncbi:TetR/AcrR family transcriptional regulator [Actinocorallia sp. API 0066]|uniref:TetR/AcrR family transcriptional regulator n=1 Tax=Actinocorallia sp. API 0066 TaxID=2896846 RepID=UPI001E396F60|nr:TetR/AcrR family transcriptional regulator [Actinocorallia sp. API 0066]MCD0449721.1 TetR/AcrR family transcriptional regulator [Actinocorallia sp. API 0066]
MADTAGGTGTRERLITAAAELFAAQGIDAVSLREIVRASGARNATALQYHFGDRDGLLRAVLARHTPDVEARRHILLDAYEAQGEPDVRALAGALVRPLAAKLADDGGPSYLRLLADLANRPRPWIDPAAMGDPANSLYRWRTLLTPLLDPTSLRLHRRFVTYRFTITELARRAQTAPHTDDRLFTSHTVDLVAALLLARPSAETARLTAERPA